MYAKVMYPDRDLVIECKRTALIHGDPPSVIVYDENGPVDEIRAPEGTDVTVYLMNSEGQTIDKFFV